MAYVFYFIVRIMPYVNKNIFCILHLQNSEIIFFVNP